MVHFILVFCLIWIAIDVVLWLVDHPGVFWFWTITALVIVGIVWLYNQTVFSVSQEMENWIGYSLLGALGAFGIWEVIADVRRFLGGKKLKRPSPPPPLQPSASGSGKCYSDAELKATMTATAEKYIAERQANAAEQLVTVRATGETDDGTPYTQYSDGLTEYHFPEGPARYYADGSIETQTSNGPVRLRTAADLAKFMAEAQQPPASKSPHQDVPNA